MTQPDAIRKYLAALLDIPSPTGMTDAAIDHVAAALSDLGLEPERTRRGALRALWRGEASERPARAICTHLDTLGAMVREIGANGRPGVAPVGTWAARFAEGARVKVHTENEGQFAGAILPLKASGHRYNKEVETQPSEWDNLEIRLDAITDSRGETRKLGVEVGDMVSIDPQPEFLENGFIVSRHLDNKAGVATLLAAVADMRGRGAAPSSDVHLLFSVSEEIGAGSAHLLPDGIEEMLAVDNAVNAPGQNAHPMGVTLVMMDAGGPYDRRTMRRLQALCRDNGIPAATDVFRHYFSDARPAIGAGADCRMGLACFACDSSHGWERTHIASLEALSHLLVAYFLVR